MREECDVREICLSALWLEIRGFKDSGGLNAPREKKEEKPKTTHSRINLKGIYVMLDSSFCCAPDVGGAVKKCTLHKLFCFIIKCQIPRLADLMDSDALGGDCVAERGGARSSTFPLQFSVFDRARWYHRCGSPPSEHSVQRQWQYAVWWMEVLETA